MVESIQLTLFLFIDVVVVTSQDMCTALVNHLSIATELLNARSGIEVRLILAI